MKGRSLFSKTRRHEAYQIRPATYDDEWTVEWLLSRAHHCYLALEWWAVQDFLGSPTLLLATDQQERPAGLVLAVTGDGPTAWLRAMAVASPGCLKPLLAAVAQAVLAQGGAGLALLGGKDWFLPQIRSSGFRQVNQVVTLRRRGRWSARQGPPGLCVRAATSADLNAILQVDHAAFAPLWWYDRRMFRRALNVSFCFDVAYLGDECVGYQFCTMRSGRGHIVRLATHPRWQHQGIGGRLLSGALSALDQAQVGSVTVNTQRDNEASLQLYRRFAFERIGTPWDVWSRSLE
jgi:GNAT superfamily N-acetyltransferase